MTPARRRRARRRGQGCRRESAPHGARRGPAGVRAAKGAGRRRRWSTSGRRRRADHGDIVAAATAPRGRAGAPVPSFSHAARPALGHGWIARPRCGRRQSGSGSPDRPPHRLPSRRPGRSRASWPPPAGRRRPGSAIRIAPPARTDSSGRPTGAAVRSTSRTDAMQTVERDQSTGYSGTSATTTKAVAQDVETDNVWIGRTQYIRFRPETNLTLDLPWRKGATWPKDSFGPLGALGQIGPLGELAIDESMPGLRLEDAGAALVHGIETTRYRLVVPPPCDTSAPHDGIAESIGSSRTLGRRSGPVGAGPPVEHRGHHEAGTPGGPGPRTRLSHRPPHQHQHHRPRVISARPPPSSHPGCSTTMAAARAGSPRSRRRSSATEATRRRRARRRGLCRGRPPEGRSPEGRPRGSRRRGGGAGR